MKEKLTPEDVTQGMVSAVNAYLLARTLAEVKREEVDKVYAEVLAEIPIYKDLVGPRSGEKLGNDERITTNKDMYLSEDEAACRRIYDEMDKRLKAAGIKPQDMETDYCPALVAEDLQRQAEWLVIDTTAGEMLEEADPEEFRHKLLCAGLEKYHQFTDLCIKLVVNHPDYVAPKVAA